MKLRARLALTTLAIALPLVVVLLWFDAVQRHGAAREALVAGALRYMAGERAQCEADPAHWGGRPLPPPGPPGRPATVHRAPLGHPDDGQRPGGAPPRLFAYDVNLVSRHPRAPVLTGEPSDGLWPGRTVRALVPMPWRDGPCAYVLALGTTNPRWLGGLVPESPLWLAPLALVLLALLVSVGPVVARIRRLTHAVHASAAEGFTSDVPAEGRDEVAELGRAFAAASAEVRRMLRERDQREQTLREYVANTTHDIMIPLTVLKAHLTNLAEHRARGEPLDESALAGAMNEAHYLGALTQNLGVAAKLDAGEPSLVRAPIDLGALVERVLARHRPIAQKLGVALDGAVPETTLEAHGDETMLEQAINNLVYNAIRYNSAGGHVGVTLDREPGLAFRLCVVDDGPGIAADELARLVQRGVRGDAARTRHPDGQGLGLSIVLRVTALHGFSLEFARSEAGGLEVVVRGSAQA